MRRFCMACDLKDDPHLIEAYKRYHLPEHIWPEIPQSIKSSGVEDMEIYLIGNRLFMIMEVNDSFTIAKKTEMDNSNETVKAWEKLMLDYQQLLPFEHMDAKWMQMERIFKL